MTLDNLATIARISCSVGYTLQLKMHHEVRVMKRGIVVGALCLLVPAVCLADAPSRSRTRAVVARNQAPVESVPDSLVGATERVLKVFKVFGDDDDAATGAAPRKASRKARKSRGAKRAPARKPRLAPAPAAEPGGILELIDSCPETLKM